ncbi:hypothetical protein E2C01_006591 [Portunus trituberculatus]|uniref:Uncharacterized protein n=1 Tax=Portunus trituberculatus TaxID=210409 RepID=A0A5B7D280_PORTR|nr:hypothetical protein [Portunus trituberculatus]
MKTLQNLRLSQSQHPAKPLARIITTLHQHVYSPSHPQLPYWKTKDWRSKNKYFLTSRNSEVMQLKSQVQL